MKEGLSKLSKKTKHWVNNSCFDYYFESNQPDSVVPFLTSEKNNCIHGKADNLCLGLIFICCYAWLGDNDCADFEHAKAQKVNTIQKVSWQYFC